MKYVRNMESVTEELIHILEDLDVEQYPEPTNIYLHLDPVTHLGTIVDYYNVGGNNRLEGDNLHFLYQYPGTCEKWHEFFYDWDLAQVLEAAGYPDDPAHVLHTLNAILYPENANLRHLLYFLEEENDSYIENLKETRESWLLTECCAQRCEMVMDLLDHYTGTYENSDECLNGGETV